MTTTATNGETTAASTGGVVENALILAFYSQIPGIIRSRSADVAPISQKHSETGLSFQILVHSFTEGAPNEKFRMKTQNFAGLALAVLAMSGLTGCGSAYSGLMGASGLGAADTTRQHFLEVLLQEALSPGEEREAAA